MQPQEIVTRGKLARYKVLHFATHGLLSGESEAILKAKAEPALILAPPNTEPSALKPLPVCRESKEKADQEMTRQEVAFPTADSVGFTSVPLVRGFITGREIIDRRTIQVADILAEEMNTPSAKSWRCRLVIAPCSASLWSAQARQLG